MGYDRLNVIMTRASNINTLRQNVRMYDVLLEVATATGFEKRETEK